MIATDVPAYGTPEWVEWRRGGLGASDLAAIVRCHPFLSEHDLWEQKRGLVPAFTGSPRTRWGHRLERVGLEVWSQANDGAFVIAPEPQPTYREERWPHLYAHLDGWGYSRDGKRVGIEVKVTAAWTEPPERVKVQCLAQMGIAANLEAVDVVRLSFDEDPVITRIERDDEAIADLLDMAEAWYVRHVIGGEEPEHREEQDADEYLTGIARELRRVQQGIERLEAAEKDIKDQVKAWVGGSGVVVGPGFRLKVVRCAGRTTTAWKDVARDLAGDDERFAAAAATRSITGGAYSAVYPEWEEEAFE